MSAELQPFLFENEHMVRTTRDEKGDPWFVAVDVCRVLGIKQASRAVENLDDDEKGVNITHTLGGPQELLTVNESGLYALIFRSRKPTARRFRKWVTYEVLPALRKTGHYEMPLSRSAAVPAIEAASLKQRVRELESKFSDMHGWYQSYIAAAYQNGFEDGLRGRRLN